MLISHVRVNHARALLNAATDTFAKFSEISFHGFKCCFIYFLKF